jgi:hypothetical protein
MTAAEFATWKEYRHRHGFDVDRLEWALALGFSALTRAAPVEFIPRFGKTAKRVDNQVKIAGLSSVAGAKVITVERYGK